MKNGDIKLYYHKTDGGAEYLLDTCFAITNGKKGKQLKTKWEGCINDKTKYIVRLDGEPKLIIVNL